MNPCTEGGRIHFLGDRGEALIRKGLRETDDPREDRIKYFTKGGTKNHLL